MNAPPGSLSVRYSSCLNSIHFRILVLDRMVKVFRSMQLNESVKFESMLIGGVHGIAFTVD